MIQEIRQFGIVRGGGTVFGWQSKMRCGCAVKVGYRASEPVMAFVPCTPDHESKIVTVREAYVESLEDEKLADAQAVEVADQIMRRVYGERSK